MWANVRGRLLLNRNGEHEINLQPDLQETEKGERKQIHVPEHQRGGRERRAAVLYQA